MLQDVMLDKEQARRRGNENAEIEDRQDAAGVIYQYMNVCECWYRKCEGYGGRGDSLKGKSTQK